MLDSAEFRNLISGHRTGSAAGLYRLLSGAIEPIYTAVVRRRNRRFDAGIGVERVGVPVVSVGNLTLGGTGKTPMVEWLARWFEARGVRVALVSRGYRAESGQQNDEARELAEKLPGVPHVQNPRRVVAARDAIERHGAQLIVLDDGFQHRRLARDLDIVLVDALEPFGFEHVFPRGTLREPLEGFARAHVIALSRSDAVDEAARRSIHDRVRQYNRDALWLELVHQPRALRGIAGESQPLEALAARRWLAFCGIGNPAGFWHALDSCGYDVCEFRAFPDHHAYVPADVEILAKVAAQSKADAVICTHKDLVKVAALPNADRALGRPLWALEVGMRIAAGQAEFEAKLATLADGISNDEARLTNE